jgi:hypothetical protein
MSLLKFYIRRSSFDTKFTSALVEIGGWKKKKSEKLMGLTFRGFFMVD